MTVPPVVAPKTTILDSTFHLRYTLDNFIRNSPPVRRRFESVVEFFLGKGLDLYPDRKKSFLQRFGGSSLGVSVVSYDIKGSTKGLLMKDLKSLDRTLSSDPRQIIRAKCLLL